MTDASPLEPKGWYPGMKSPNPAGRPAGRTPMAQLQKRMLEEGPAVFDALLAKAREGDPACAGLVLMVAPMTLDGPINGDWFEAYVRHVLVPTLRPGDVVIMDNLSSHKRAAVREMIEAAGARLLFLPP